MTNMPDDGRIICPNCQIAIRASWQAGRSPLQRDSFDDSKEILLKRVRYRLALCPGEPWCEVTEAEKEKL